MPGQILVLASMKIPLCPALFQQQQLRAVKAAGIHQRGQLAGSQSWRFDTQIRRSPNTHSAVSLFISITFNSQNSCTERGVPPQWSHEASRPPPRRHAFALCFQLRNGANGVKAHEDGREDPDSYCNTQAVSLFMWLDQASEQENRLKENHSH